MLLATGLSDVGKNFASECCLICFKEKKKKGKKKEKKRKKKGRFLSLKASPYPL